MKSKFELRYEAVKLAVNTEGVNADNIIEVSNKIARFIIGEVELPETYDIEKNAMAFMESIKKLDSHEDIKQKATTEA